jgi:DNA adenine methylase
MKRAVLHWHGGKFRIADWIVNQFPEHKLYVEPFGGAASVLIRKRPCQTEIYNDLDDRLYRVFKTIREKPEELAEALMLTTFSRKELHLCYESQDYDTINDVEFARRIITITHLAISSTSMNELTGFRGSVNSSIRSSVTGNGDYCSQASTFSKLPFSVLQLRDRLQNVIIENVHYSKLIKRYNRGGVLWYFDPPYMPETRSNSSNRRGYKFNMSVEDHQELLEQILQLQGFVMISGYDNELYNDVLKNWHKEYTRTHTDGRVKKTECVWKNYRKAEQRRLF